MKHYETGCEWPNKQNTPQLYPHTHILADSYMYMYIQEGEKTHRRDTQEGDTQEGDTRASKHNLHSQAIAHNGQLTQRSLGGEGQDVYGA